MHRVTDCAAGSSPNKDREKSCSSNYWEVLHTSDVGLPHQQADMWRDCHHSQQETAQ